MGSSPIGRTIESTTYRDDNQSGVLRYRWGTNLAFGAWNTVFPNATSIATLLDKLTHRADVTLIEGESYRVHESRKEAAARRKKKP